jgi:SAM-dependent methyltransferase
VLDPKRFAEIQAADLAKFPDRRFLCRWEISQELHSWTGPADLRRWLDHIESRSSKLDHAAWRLAVDEAALERARSFNEAVLSRIFGVDAPAHDTLDLYDMTDWVFIEGYPRPAERLERVLDFGAGFGRQAAVWLTLGSPMTYVAVDSIELPYLAQSMFLSATEHALVEYMGDTSGFNLDADGRAYHLPGWRHDLLHDDFFDLVLCVQVLPELREDVLIHSLRTFKRVLRQGGRLYVRDHPDWQPAHKQNTERLLARLGFKPEFTPRLRDRVDCHGVPRVYQLADGVRTSAPSRARTFVKSCRRVWRRLRYLR